MKKKVLLVAALFSAAFVTSEAQAQDYKAAAGDKTVEVNFTPFGGSPISISGLKFRSFTSETSAFRLGINLAYSSNSQDPVLIDTDGDGENDEELVDKSSTFGINLEPGIEKHFAGTDRLSPYIGGVATIGYNRSSVTEQSYDDPDATDSSTDMEVIEDKTTDGSLNLGVRAVLGADWYFTEKMYLGIEVGYGILYTSNNDTKYEYGKTIDPDNRPEETPRGSDLKIGPTFNSALRLGYAF